MYENSKNYNIIVELKVVCKTHLIQLVLSHFNVKYLRNILNLLSGKQVKVTSIIIFQMHNSSVKNEIKEGEFSSTVKIKINNVK